MLANGDGGYGAILWNLRTGRGTRLPQGTGRYVLSLAWDRTGTRLVTVDGGDPAGHPSHAELWDVSRRPARRLATWDAENAQGWATSVGFSPTANIVATGTSSGVISLRDASTGRLMQNLDVPNGYNGVLAFSADGKNLALLTRDGAEIWNIASGTEIGTGLPGASPQAQTPGGPGNLRYTPDNHLIMVSPNGLLTIWNVDPAAWNAAACRIAARQLTGAEWSRFVTTQPYARVCP
jgi:WD40 repeat protein